MSGVSIAAPDGNTDFWGTKASDLQTGVTVSGNNITGTLKYLSSGQLVTDWGAGNFLAIAFSASNWSAYTSVKVGLENSAGSGLAELINDPDKMDVFKVSNKDMQRLMVVLTNSTGATNTIYYNLDGLTCEES